MDNSKTSAQITSSNILHIEKAPFSCNFCAPANKNYSEVFLQRPRVWLPHRRLAFFYEASFFFFVFFIFVAESRLLVRSSCLSAPKIRSVLLERDMVFLVIVSRSPFCFSGSFPAWHRRATIGHRRFFSSNRGKRGACCNPENSGFPVEKEERLVDLVEWPVTSARARLHAASSEHPTQRIRQVPCPSACTA